MIIHYSQATPGRVVASSVNKSISVKVENNVILYVDKLEKLSLIIQFKFRSIQSLD